MNNAMTAAASAPTVPTKRRKRRGFDLAALKQIPILQVCDALGLKLQRTGHDRWNMLNDEGLPTSLEVCGSKNLWNRFSAGRGGDVIALVEYIQSLKFHGACEYLHNLL